MSRRFDLLHSLSGVLALSVLSSAQQVFTVGDADNDYTGLQAAIDAVPDGSVIVVEVVVLDVIAIDGKSLSIFADPEADQQGFLEHSWIAGATITNLAEGQEVVLRGFDLGGLDMRFENNAGTIWIESAEVRPFSFGHSASFETFTFIECQDVAFRNVVVSPDTYGFPHGDALRILSEHSTLRFFDCTIEGASPLPVPSILLHDSVLTLTDSSVSGGSSTGCAVPGAPAIRSTGSASRLYLRNSSLEGGYAGGIDDGFEDCGASDQAPRLEILDGGEIAEIPSFAIDWIATPIVAPGEPRSAFFTGDAGTLVWLVYTADPSMVTAPHLRTSGLRALASPMTFASVRLNANGRALLQHAPTLPPGVGADVIFAQPIAFHPAGSIALGPPSALLVRNDN